MKNNLTTEAGLRGEFVQPIEGEGVDLKSKRKGIRSGSF